MARTVGLNSPIGRRCKADTGPGARGTGRRPLGAGRNRLRATAGAGRATGRKARDRPDPIVRFPAPGRLRTVSGAGLGGAALEQELHPLKDLSGISGKSSQWRKDVSSNELGGRDKSLFVGYREDMSIITDTATLAAACKRLARFDIVTVDTEFMRETTFWPKLCVVQLASPEEAVIVDATAADLSLDPFFKLMAERECHQGLSCSAPGYRDRPPSGRTDPPPGL